MFQKQNHHCNLMKKCFCLADISSLKSKEIHIIAVLISHISVNRLTYSLLMTKAVQNINEALMQSTTFSLLLNYSHRFMAAILKEPLLTAASHDFWLLLFVICCVLTSLQLRISVIQDHFQHFRTSDLDKLNY